jgi:hypothetical protein
VAAEPKRWRRLSWSSLSASVISWGWLLSLLISRLAPIVYTSIYTHTHTHTSRLSLHLVLLRESSSSSSSWWPGATRPQDIADFSFCFFGNREEIHTPLSCLSSLSGPF